MYGKMVYITFILANNHHKVPLYSHLVLCTACVCYIHALRSHVCSELHLTYNQQIQHAYVCAVRPLTFTCVTGITVPCSSPACQISVLACVVCCSLYVTGFLEKQFKLHIRSFEMNGFKDFKSA